MLFHPENHKRLRQPTPDRPCTMNCRMAGGAEGNHPVRVLELLAVMNHSSKPATDAALMSVPLQNLIPESVKVLSGLPSLAVTDAAQSGLGDQTDTARAGWFKRKHRLRCHASSIEQKEKATCFSTSHQDDLGRDHHFLIPRLWRIPRSRE